MNPFDAVVYFGLVIAMVAGFNTGLVRSAVTILAYLVAVPIAMWAMSALSPPANGKVVSAFAQNGLVFFGVFLFAGMALGKLARLAVDEATGSTCRASGPPLRRRAGRGARRPDCGHDRCGLRPARADFPSTAMADRLEAAAMAVGGRAERLQFATARPRRNHRSPERAADIVVQIRCHAFRVASSQPLTGANGDGRDLRLIQCTVIPVGLRIARII